MAETFGKRLRGPLHPWPHFPFEDMSIIPGDMGRCKRSRQSDNSGRLVVAVVPQEAAVAPLCDGDPLTGRIRELPWPPHDNGWRCKRIVVATFQLSRSGTSPLWKIPSRPSGLVGLLGKESRHPARRERGGECQEERRPRALRDEDAVVEQG